MERVGFIGLGSMGVPMCRHILAHGFPLTVLDTHPQTVEQMVASGASAAADPEQVGAACDVVLVMVPSDEDVMEVITGATGILMGAEPGTVIAVCSSTLPETCAHAAEIASQKGVGLVDSPVARGVRGALAADLTVFAGGDPAHLDKCRPIFETFAGRVFYMGSVGKGQVTKTVNNLIHWVEVVGIYEALRLGLDHGVHPNQLRPALLSGSVDSRTLRELHLVGLAWPHKDMQNAMRMAERTHTALPLMEQVGELVVGMNKEQLRALFVEAEIA